MKQNLLTRIWLRFLKPTWDDPVGSKIIASIITASLGYVVYSVYSSGIPQTGVLVICLSICALLWVFSLFYLRKKSISKRRRSVARAGVFVLPVLFLGLITWKFWPKPSNNTKIIVMEFEGPKAEDLRVTDKIVNELNKIAGEYPEIEIEHDETHLKEGSGSKRAREIGEAKGAGIVLWGYYTMAQTAFVVAHFEMIRPVRGLLDLKEITLEKDGADPSSFNIRIELSTEIKKLVLLTIGLARYDVEDFDGAISRFSNAIDLPLSLNSMLNPAIIHFYRGSAIQLKGDDRRALPDYARALELGWINSALFNNLGNIYYNLGNDDEAERNYKLAAERNENNAEAQYNLGNICTRRGHYGPAISQYDRAIKLAPNYINAYGMRGNAYAKKGNFIRAIADYSTALIRYNNASEHNPMSRYTLLNARGLANTSAGKFDDAFDDLNVAIRLDPKEDDAYWNLGIFYLHKNNPKRDKNVGLEYLKKARELAEEPETLPRDADILRSLQVE